MQKVFDALIDGYLLDKVGISENFLSLALSKNLKENLVKLFEEKKLITAKTGIGNETNLNTAIRSDKIFWLDRIHENQHENDFFDIMDAFVLFLNQTCYTGITSYEFHYALYEKGSFYKKHFDQFKSNASRQYTMIFYLNTDWKLADGGELCVYFKDSSQNISPTNGKSVFFKSSELEHEVLLSHAQRMSITGWFRVD
ncbi:2OG-Fe(II) oxygenase [Lacihabitans soyangensis]|uniref:2OG-Fe(II) oxygenase n=1 Tax=Lacihabitans soyangensis TaxID=869394 RepID=A0AAE3H2G6_9BACT|nr:2OG-Fe(II) oxygenase [Lacihabitans soyangensis]MCP9763742.1 2OG-Fe(II) oxygenase [Lacihabitans soyangensis]